jgi:hypothetical protein
MSAAERYLRSMRANMPAVEATWFPGDLVAVGDIGVFKHGVFHKRTSLGDLGISYAIEVAEAPQDIGYSRGATTTLASSAAAGVPGIGDVTVEVTLSGTGAYIFHAAGVKQHALANRADVFSRILDIAKDRETWKRKWNVIGSVYAADCATILVSTGQAAHMTLTGAAGGLPAALLLVDPRLGVHATFEHGDVLHVVAREASPLYACYRVTRWLFGEPDIAPVRDSDAADPSSWFVRPSLAERLEEDPEIET